MAARYLYRQFVQRVVQINDRPESIAWGATLGMFVAMTPTVGVQMIIILILNTVVRANRLAGVVMVYVSNPFTMIPIYWLDYVVGAKVMGKTSALSKDAFADVFTTFADRAAAWELWEAFSGLGNEIVVPMFVGGGILGVIFAIPVYPISLKLVRGHQRRKAHREALYNLRDARREARRLEREAEERARAEVQGSTPVERESRTETD